MIIEGKLYGQQLCRNTAASLLMMTIVEQNKNNRKVEKETSSVFRQLDKLSKTLNLI